MGLGSQQRTSPYSQKLNVDVHKYAECCKENPHPPAGSKDHL